MELGLEKYEKRICRIADHLEILGLPFTESEQGELVHSAVYLRSLKAMKLAGTIAQEDVGAEVRYLKSEFAELILYEPDSDDEDSEEQREDRECKTSAIIRLLRNRGHHVSASKDKVFSGPATAGRPSPERVVGDIGTAAEPPVERNLFGGNGSPGEVPVWPSAEVGGVPGFRCRVLGG